MSYVQQQKVNTQSIIQFSMLSFEVSGGVTQNYFLFVMFYIIEVNFNSSSLFNRQGYLLLSHLNYPLFRLCEKCVRHYKFIEKYRNEFIMSLIFLYFIETGLKLQLEMTCSIITFESTFNRFETSQENIGKRIIVNQQLYRVSHNETI